MAGETGLTIIGNATGDAELKFTPSGAPVAKFRVASTPRFMKDGKWVDGDPLFMQVVVWREMAEHVAASVAKGTRVVVTGYLKQRSYVDKENVNRTVIELEAQEVGISLRYAEAKVTKFERSHGAQVADPGDDPWAGTDAQAHA